MTAPLATLVFLTAMWLVTIVIADMLNQSLTKILAALKGRSPLAAAPTTRPVAVRVSQRSRQQQVLHAQPRLRAAA